MCSKVDTPSIEILIEQIRCRVDSGTTTGSLALVEIQEWETDADDDSFVTPATRTALLQKIALALGADAALAWHGARLIILLHQSATAQSALRLVWREIATFEFAAGDGPVHLTPVIGYADLRKASTPAELWDMAEAALAFAGSSLEIEPFRYVRKLERPQIRKTITTPAALWRRVPQWLALSIQLVISLVIGLGAPFILYAVCDALGTDISGPVYIGVVVVLVITATMIWIEGLLALKSTEPPLAPGSPPPWATIIIPAYLPNEAETIVETINAFLRLDYPNKVQIIVAYNAPSPFLPVEDELRRVAASQPEGSNFIIEPVRVAGSTSKAQNVNSVIGRVRGAFVGIFDADHHPQPDSLNRAWRWLSNGWDIVQGRCSVRNGTDSWVSRMVAVEFEQIYAVSHPGRARLHGFGIFGGSNGFWRTAVLHETRMRHAMLTEDIDSSIRAVEAGYRIAGDRDLISEELAPTGLNQLLNQRLRWAQGWFQVSLRRVVPALVSPNVTVRQKLGLVHLLVWRELFPWYSIQVVPIMTYWVWVYGWHYIHWAVPIFLATTAYTLSTGPGQILLAYKLAQKSMRRKPMWFFQYFFVSIFFYSPFKDTLSRIAHIKEAMRERAWRVTPRARTLVNATPQFAALALVVVLAMFPLAVAPAVAQAPGSLTVLSREKVAVLLGGEAATIHAAREAARVGQNAKAAQLYSQAIADVPTRRGELLRPYADVLSYAGRNVEAAALYKELLAAPGTSSPDRKDMLRRQAGALEASRQYKAALAAYGELLRQDPNAADIAVRRARMLWLVGEGDHALAALDRVPPAAWAHGQLGKVGDEILLGAARAAATRSDSKQSARLFERAIDHNPELRRPLLQEYADQLTYSGRPSEAVPLYREAIKNASPGSGISKEAQHGLSLALTWAKSPAEAIGAWDAYLKHAPGDTDALLHQAQALSARHQSERALGAYQAVYVRAPRNAAARRGIVDETTNLARYAARANRHDEAVRLFSAALRLDRSRSDLLREYADQLSFAGRSGEAVALYREALGGLRGSDDRKRAMIGLANAYAWSGQPDAAAKSYVELVTAYPEDSSLNWTRLVFTARQAAQADRNKEAASLFAQASALAPDRRPEILREFADQLSFTGRSAEAVPLYREVLTQSSLSDADRMAASGGLAQAEAWSGKFVEAKAAYTALLAHSPEDKAVQWNLLVVSARDAAQKDQNRASADFFAQAIKLDADRAPGLLREYADQLSFTGRAYRAIPVYVEMLGQPGLTDDDRWSAKKGLARAYSWSGRFKEAKAGYEELVDKFPADRALRGDLLVAGARQAAKENRNKDAAQLYADVIRFDPARRSGLLREYADKLTFSDQAKAALPLYRELLAEQHKPDEVRSTRLALALALSWSGDNKSALKEYETLVAANPNDDPASLGEARILSWTGRQVTSKTIYEQILARSPTNADAQRGLAQVEDWQGHHRAAQAILNKRLYDDPNDLEARRLLAQSEAWMGRPDKALGELKVATTVQKPVVPPKRPSPKQPIIPASLSEPRG